ncbi:unnamed protein product [Rotaria sp. Silwood1]|nr:unnamed protein product [Rotaria sp. Silwood1]CAF3632261.1 unnamed protein product [Rotaria sp. Silwood1]CAF4595907.1 unnamed protein product [Rotaria sp. Silwood1]
MSTVTCDSPMLWLHVVQPNLTAGHYGYIADEYERHVILRGVDVETEQRNIPADQDRPIDPSLYNGQCPSNIHVYQEPPTCEIDYGKGMYNINDEWNSHNDFAQIRRWGFNVIRLCLSWSALEPTPGNYSEMYLQRVEQIIEWASEQQVYVILDMHEDLYSRYIFGDKEHEIPPYLTASDGQDGAPQWAVMTDGWPALAFFGIGNLNLAMMKAFDNFYNNSIPSNATQGNAPGPGLQDHYIGAIAFLAKKFVNNSAVLGYEIMNEPQPGTYIDQYTFSSDYLYPFYKRAIQAITGVRDNLPDCPKHAPTGTNCAYPNLGINDKRHLFFVEPTSVRNLLDFTPQHSIPFSSYTNIVYAPHVYTHVFTIDSILHLNRSFYPPSFDYAYETALNESVGLQSAILVTEFGCGADADETLLIPTIDSQDKAMISATIWPWKNNCFQEGCETSWSLYDSGTLNDTVANQNGPERPNRVRLLSRVHPRGVIGQLIQYFYNTTTSSFIMTAKCNNKTLLLSNNETIIYIPRQLNSSVINVTGEATIKKIIKNPDQSRLVLVYPTCNGEYHIFVANNTNQIGELYQKTVINGKSNIEPKNGHETIQSMKKAYELFQHLHAAAVKTGETFVATSSNFVNKFTALQNAVEINIKHIMPLLNKFRKQA